MVVGGGQARAKASLDLKIFQFHIERKRLISLFRVGKIKINHFWHLLENFLSSPGNNPSDAHVAATGTIMHVIGSNSKVYYDIAIINYLHNRLSAEFPSRVLLFNEALP